MRIHSLASAVAAALVTGTLAGPFFPAQALGPSGAAWVIGPTVPTAEGELTAGTQAPDSRNLVVFGVDPAGRTFAYTLDTEAPSPGFVRVPVPDVGRVSNTDEGRWAVADTAALHWSEGRWQRHAFVRRPGTRLRMRAIGTAMETWAVGTETVPGSTTSRGVVQRWDGARWQVVPIPSDLLDSTSSLTTLYASDPLTVFGTDHDRTRGDRAIALAFDGKRWRSLALPTRSGWIDRIDDAAAPGIATGWTAPTEAPQRRRPLLYALNHFSGRWDRVDLPGGYVAAELTAAATDYGQPIALGNSANGGLYALVGQHADDGALRMVRDEVPRIRAAIADTTGTIRHQLWAVGYRLTPRGRSPLVLAYETAEPARTDTSSTRNGHDRRYGR